MPALSNTPERRSNSALRPNASRASAFASACSITYGGTAVASESKEQGCILPNFSGPEPNGGSHYEGGTRGMTKRLIQAALFLVLASCGSSTSTTAQPARSSEHPFAATPVATFDSPWAMDFLPGSNLGIVTEKPGRVWLVDVRTGQKQPVAGAPKVVVSSQGGLLDIKAAPTFASDGIVYLTYAEPSANGGSGHRNPYGLAFDARGRLWETEMGPRGGDELNLILPGRNYGWPLVSNGKNYDGNPIPPHSSRPDLEAPKIYWVPSISPTSLLIYRGNLFAQWKGSGFIGALSAKALIRVTLNADNAQKADQWDMGKRIRWVGQGPDGAIYLLEDGADARLLRLTPK